MAFQEQQYGTKWLSEDESFMLAMRIDTISGEEHFLDPAKKTLDKTFGADLKSDLTSISSQKSQN
jgi:hypothetical protein